MPNIKHVTSLQNDTIKLLRSLDMRKARAESGLFIAEGVKLVLMALEQGWQPEILLFDGMAERSAHIDKILSWAHQANAEILDVPADILSKLSTKDNPQSVIAAFRQRWVEPVDILHMPTLVLALEQVRDPGNLGTIIRTSDATGADGILLISNCCDPYAREAVRASMGSVFGVRLAKMSADEFADVVAKWKGEIIGTHLSDDSVDFRRDYKAPSLLVMGSEGPGLSEALARQCTQLVKIPMGGHADSLNLAIATSLMLYEIRRTNKAD